MLSTEELQWVEEILGKVSRKMEKVSARSAHKIPYTTVNGIHDDKSNDRENGWWTNGFWGGLMWQMYALTGMESYKSIALENEEKLDANLVNYDKLDHDNGFKWLPTSVAHYRLTGDKRSKSRGLVAAGNLAGRFNSNGNFIRAWNDWEGNPDDHRGWAIIDCMMNLPLLYWAAEETGDPRFYQVAVKHADKAMKYFIREDGSAHHIVEFNPDNGEFVRSYGGQGMDVGTSWTRGQSWGLYGFVLSYIHTKDKKYLDTAEKIAEYFMKNIPKSGLIPVDFYQPKEITWLDDTAAAIASCGFIELAKQVGEEKGRKYLDAALSMLRALADSDVNWNEEEDNLLMKCTAAYHDKNHEFSIIYGDYYFVEALMKLSGKELFIW